MFTELIVDESNFSEIVLLETQYECVTISNQQGIEVDEHAFIEHWKNVGGVEHVRILSIDYDSSLKNVNVLSAFPNVKNLILSGRHIASLEGIEYFKHGEYICMDTYKNRRRNIAQISQTKVNHILLSVERIEDLSAIAECKYLTSLELRRSMQLDLTTWSSVPLNSMVFKRGKFKELGETATIPSLMDLDVLGCRNLERFTGDNSRITRLLIDACKKLDLRTLKTFEGIETLIVNSCTYEMNLTEIGGLKNVKSIDFILCNVQVDLINLKEYFPNIESLHISHMKKEYGMKLKELNPDVHITGRSFSLD